MTPGLFTRTGTTWSQEAKLTASEAARGDVFGFSVSISGNRAIVGAFQDDDAGLNSVSGEWNVMSPRAPRPMGAVQAAGVALYSLGRTVRDNIHSRGEEWT